MLEGKNCGAGCRTEGYLGGEAPDGHENELPKPYPINDQTAPKGLKIPISLGNNPIQKRTGEPLAVTHRSGCLGIITFWEI